MCAPTRSLMAPSSLADVSWMFLLPYLAMATLSALNAGEGKGRRAERQGSGGWTKGRSRDDGQSPVVRTIKKCTLHVCLCLRQGHRKSVFELSEALEDGFFVLRLHCVKVALHGDLMARHKALTPIGKLRLQLFLCLLRCKAMV